MEAVRWLKHLATRRLRGSERRARNSNDMGKDLRHGPRYRPVYGPGKGGARPCACAYGAAALRLSARSRSTM